MNCKRTVRLYRLARKAFDLLTGCCATCQVRGYAQAGFAGILIEDQVAPKQCGHMRTRQVGACGA
jgi:hypothetical protein